MAIEDDDDAEIARGVAETDWEELAAADSNGDKEMRLPRRTMALGRLIVGDILTKRDEERFGDVSNPPFE